MPPGVLVAVGDVGFDGVELPDGVVRAEVPRGNLVSVLRSRTVALSG